MPVIILHKGRFLCLLLSLHPPEYSLFNSAIEAESVLHLPGDVRGGVPEGVELAVKCVYAADKTITMPYKDNLQSLLHEPSFRFAVDRNVWRVLPSIVKVAIWRYIRGNSVSAADAVFSLRGCSISSSGWIAAARTMWSARAMVARFIPER